MQLSNYPEFTADALSVECFNARAEIRRRHRRARKNMIIAADDWAQASEYVILGINVEDR